MKLYKKIILLSAILVLVPSFVMSASWSGLERLGKVKDKVVINEEINLSTSLENSIANVIKTVLIFSGVIFLVLTVYASILWMTASGNQEQVDKAKKVIMTTTIGLGITFFAYVITAMVTNYVGGSSFTNSEQEGYCMYKQGSFWFCESSSVSRADCEKKVGEIGFNKPPGVTEKVSSVIFYTLDQKQDCIDQSLINNNL